jgi:hypothetical protein
MVQQQLATIIQNIQMEGRSGLLVVKRGQGGILEEGSILFVNGKMQEAKAGRRTKFDAFKYLCTWENYEFSFRTPDGQIQHITLPTPTSREHRAGPAPAQLSTPIPSSLRSNQNNTGGLVAWPYNFVPYHTRRQLSEGLQVVEKMGLTRAHRRLFMLVNGERSVAELARLTASSETEVYQHLQDLERAAVVRIQEKS